MNLYHHKTDGGAEYLYDTFIECKNGHKEGVINDKTRVVVRIDGDITKDCELIRPDLEAPEYIKEQEQKLFKIAERVLEWGQVKYKKRELADLVMLELFDIL